MTENTNSTSEEEAVTPEAEAHEDGEEKVIDEDFVELMKKRQIEEQEKFQQHMTESAEKLRERISTDPEMERLGYAMLFGYRMIQWAASKVSELPDVTQAMLTILIRAQERASRDDFQFVDMIEDFEKNQMPWLESKRKDALMKREARKKRLKEFTARLRRKDIELPFHSMTRAFGDEGFTHEKAIYLVGPSAALQPVIRYCTKMYQKAGGVAALLSRTGEKDKKIAQITLGPDQWRNCAEIYGTTIRMLRPVTTGLPNKQVGLMAMDSLAEAFVTSMPPIPMEHRMAAASAMLEQYQQERGMALIIGIPNDEYPQGVDIRNLLPWMDGKAYVNVNLENSKLVGGGQNVIVGNDIMPFHQLTGRLADE